MPEITVTAKTVDEAIDEACRRLNIDPKTSKTSASYEVLQRERGFPFKRPAIIRVTTEKPEKIHVNIPKEIVHINRESQNIPKCPTCQSTDVKKISGSKRWLTTGLFGIASGDFGKTMECKNCGYKW